MWNIASFRALSNVDMYNAEFLASMRFVLYWANDLVFYANISVEYTFIQIYKLFLQLASYAIMVEFLNGN